MKVKIGKYADRLVCNIHSNHMEKKYGLVNWPEVQDRKDDMLESIEDRVQSVYAVFNWLWFDIILPMLVQLKETKHGSPNVDDEDVPKRLRSTKKQQEKYNKDGSTDPKFFERWDCIMDEMIWAFEQKCRDHWEEDYYGLYIEGEDGKFLNGRFEWTDDKGRNAHQERMTNGFKLFGKYFESLWD